MADSPPNPAPDSTAHDLAGPGQPATDPLGSEPPETDISKALGSEYAAVVEQRAKSTHGPLIQFSHVNISFDGRAVLEDVSFEVERGQTLCILGRSGVGKSVSLRLLMGFLKPDSGSIRIENEEITSLDEEGMREVRKKVTMVFQNGALFDSLNVRENVAFPLRERGGLAEDQIVQIVDRLISMVGADDVTESLPASLSTGRKRAVAIARALAAQPEIVLYDEPTTMVDPIIARRLGDLIQRLKGQLGFTSIVVTHDMRFAERLADTVLFLHEGRAAYFGPLSGFIDSADPNIQQFLYLDAYLLPLG
jgi:phospholipid/cholesterol/gamma-HCH transport system ATP-binding protein